MDTQQGFAEVNGTRLYYEVTGTGRPIVLIHGFSLNLRMWDDQIEALSENYRVIRYDVRGFGKSAMPTDRNHAHADDLMALLEHLGESHAYIGGLSMGGAITLHFVHAYPNATDAAILVDSVAGIWEWSQNFVEGFAAPMRAKAAEAGIEAANELLKVQPVFAPAMEQPRLVTQLDQILGDYPGWHWVNDNPLHSADPPGQEGLEKITAPTLIIYGERDNPGIRTTAATMQERIPNARTVVMAGVGHMTNMEDPKTFNKAVLDFLSEL